ncbi:MAG: SUMF1/EgtB/PvdO family nonheme iron enzyme [Candidatus Sumerlaeota bacterium]|nr:SUMF1/EgtB/PvdO family nonheme iron enzyme [Candidatus Sumerlaeota bacterium]
MKMPHQFHACHILAAVILGVCAGVSAFGAEKDNGQPPAIASGAIAARSGPSVIEGASRNWLVAVGVNRFDDTSVAGLEYCVSDATSIFNVFSGPGKLVPASQSYLLVSGATDRSLVPTRANILRTIAYAAEQATADSTLLIDLSAHGFLDDQGRSFLFPQDGDVRQLFDTAVPLARIDEILAASKATRKIMFVDACRNTPRRGVRGANDRTDAKELFKNLQASQGKVALVSCDAGQISNEAAEFRHGVFTYYLLEGLRGKARTDKNGFVTFSGLMEYVCDEVPNWAKRTTRPPQNPWMWGAMSGSIPLSIPSVALASGDSSGKNIVYEAYDRGPASTPPASNPPAPIPPEPVPPEPIPPEPIPPAPLPQPNIQPNGAAPAPVARTEIVPLGAGVALALVYVKGDGNIKDFRMSQTEITQEQFQAVMKIPHKSSAEGRGLPVDMISWEEANRFCEELTRRTGRAFALPTENQWDHACQEGGGDPLGRDLPNMAWFGENSGGHIRLVGTRLSNAIGIYDMLGNVSEWCSDYFDATNTTRVVRGGNYLSQPAILKTTFRQPQLPDRPLFGIGLRVVRND